MDEEPLLGDDGVVVAGELLPVPVEAGTEAETEVKETEVVVREQLATTNCQCHK